MSNVIQYFESFRNMMRLLISLTIWLLGFSVADIIDSLLDDAVVNLLSGSGREGRIKITSSLSLFFLKGLLV